MKPSSKKSAFTLTELLVVTAIVAFLSLMLVPAFAKTLSQRTRVNCVSNLKQIGLAFHLWAASHQNRYPMMVGGDPSAGPSGAGEGGAFDALFRYTPPKVFAAFLVMSNELGNPGITICPVDNRYVRTSWASTPASSTNFSDNGAISYFVGLSADESMPKTLLSGDRYIGPSATQLFGSGGYPTGGGIYSLNPTNSPQIQWSPSIGHVGNGNVVLSDGSVQLFSTKTLQDALRESGDTNNSTAFPQ
jgi:prepilin-type N-terminal cleavage/methylation domain-containing protein